MESLALNPQPVWHTSIGRGITGSPALAEDVVAVSSVDHRAVLLDRATGSQIWDRRLPNAIGAGPLLRDDRLFVAELTSDGRVYALRLRTGKTIWSVKTGDVVAPLALDSNALYVGATNGFVGRLSPDSGKWTWRARIAGAVRAAPVPVAAGLIVATTSDSLFLLDSGTGRVLVRRGTRGTVLAAPARGDSLVVIGTTSGTLEAVDARTLQTKWSHDVGDPIVGSVAISGGNVYALTGRGVLIVVPLGNPRAVRRFPLDLVVRAGPAPTSAGVFVSAVTGEFVLFDSTGTRRWAARLESPMVEPALVDGHTIIASSRHGEMVAYR